MFPNHKSRAHQSNNITAVVLHPCVPLRLVLFLMIGIFANVPQVIKLGNKINWMKMWPN